MELRKEFAYKQALTKLLSELFSDSQYLMDIPDSSDGLDASLEFTKDVTIYSKDMWTKLVEKLQNIDEFDIFSDDTTTTLRFINESIRPSFTNNLTLCFSYTQYSYEQDEDFDYSEIDGMSKEDAIEYLTESLEYDETDEVPEVEYVCVSINPLPLNLNWSAALIPTPNSTDLQNFINQIKDTFRKIPDVLAIEDEKLNAEDLMKQEYEQRLNIVAESLRPVLSENGWEGQFCIEHFTKDIYKLYIKVDNISSLSCRGNTEEIKLSIPKLIQLAHQYMALMSELGSNFFIGRGSQTKDLKWIEI